MPRPFAEYRDVKVAEPLRQGDILEAADEDASIWRRHLCVLTADCDFAHDKHCGRVTCVPLLPAENYLTEFQVPKLRERLVRKPLVSLHDVLAAVGGPRVSDERLRAWATEQVPDEIVSTLGLQGGPADEARTALSALRLIDSPAPRLAEAVDALVQAQLVGPAPPKRENAVKSVITLLQESYVRPPGDALFLGAIAPGQEDGYFAYLRHLEQIVETDIAVGPARRVVAYRRVARLEDRFTHALVQRFAMVFLSIGLPKEYEEMRDLHADLLWESLA